MSNKITAEEVAQQFAKSIRMLLEWIEQRDKVTIKDILKPKIDEYDKNELLNAAEAAKILKIGKSMTYQMMQKGEIPTIRLGRSVRVKVGDLEQFIEANSI